MISKSAQSLSSVLYALFIIRVHPCHPEWHSLPVHRAAEHGPQELLALKGKTFFLFCFCFQSTLPTCTELSRARHTHPHCLSLPGSKGTRRKGHGVEEQRVGWAAPLAGQHLGRPHLGCCRVNPGALSLGSPLCPPDSLLTRAPWVSLVSLSLPSKPHDVCGGQQGAPQTCRSQNPEPQISLHRLSLQRGSRSIS